MVTLNDILRMARIGSLDTCILEDDLFQSTTSNTDYKQVNIMY